jgi:hypothetical protein
MTTAKPKIPTLPGNPSKQEEMDFLNAVFDAVPKESYLRKWVSTDMTRWLDFQIRDDRSCDIYAEYQHEIAEGEALRSSNARLQLQIGALNERCGNYAKQCNDYAKQCHDYGVENQKQTDQLFIETTEAEQLSKTLDKLLKENDAMRDTIGRHYDRTKVLTDLVWKFGSDDQKDRDEAQQFFDDAKAVGAFQ